jgi:hydroxymethylpyrimidine pyrophosphatase-like HAD family hydrolase
MRIIFLDIDGVMLSYKERGEGKRHGFTKECVEALNLLNDSDTGIVVTSSWRLENTIDKIRELFEFQEVKIPVVGLTPDLGWGSERGSEIKKYLLDKGNIDSYVVIDDQVKDITEHIPYGVFKTNHLTGLTRNDISYIEDNSWAGYSLDKV